MVKATSQDPTYRHDQNHSPPLLKFLFGGFRHPERHIFTQRHSLQKRTGWNILLASSVNIKPDQILPQSPIINGGDVPKHAAGPQIAESTKPCVDSEFYLHIHTYDKV